MRLSATIAAMGVVMVVGSTAAHAQESRAERTATAAEVPWHERFTFSAGQEQQAPAWSSVNPRAPVGTETSGRWGLSVNVGEAERTESGPPSDRTAIGAYYRFTPHVRLGGRLSVTEEPTVVGSNESEREATKAGVRLESAFRF